MSKKLVWIALPILVIFASVIVFAAVSQNEPEPRATPAASEEQPDAVEDAAVPTMLELGSEGCIPCEKMKPVMAALEEKYGDKIEIQFHDVRKNPAIAQQYRIRLIPTQIFLKADGTEFFRHEGYFAQEDVEKVFSDMGVSP